MLTQVPILQVVISRPKFRIGQERLTTGSNNQTSNSFSPDEEKLVFGELVAPRDLQLLSMEGERISQPLF